MSRHKKYYEVWNVPGNLVVQWLHKPTQQKGKIQASITNYLMDRYNGQANALDAKKGYVPRFCLVQFAASLDETTWWQVHIPTIRNVYTRERPATWGEKDFSEPSKDDFRVACKQTGISVSLSMSPVAAETSARPPAVDSGDAYPAWDGFNPYTADEAWRKAFENNERREKRINKREGKQPIRQDSTGSLASATSSFTFDMNDPDQIPASHADQYNRFKWGLAAPVREAVEEEPPEQEAGSKGHKKSKKRLDYTRERTMPGTMPLPTRSPSPKTLSEAQSGWAAPVTNDETNFPSLDPSSSGPAGGPSTEKQKKDKKPKAKKPEKSKKSKKSQKKHESEKRRSGSSSEERK